MPREAFCGLRHSESDVYFVNSLNLTQNSQLIAKFLPDDTKYTVGSL